MTPPPQPDPNRRLVQFWDQPAPPPEVAALMAEWQAAFAGGYRRFDHASATDYLAGRFPARIRAAFACCAVPAMQADFFRYCVLYAEGGLYVDADTRPIGDLAALAGRAARAMLMDRRGRTANDVMFFRHPQDPLLSRVIDIATANIEAARSNNVWQVTGPGIMTALRADPAEAHLFVGIDILPVMEVGQAVRFVWTMDYKDGAEDWRRADSIFRDRPPELSHDPLTTPKPD
ncbi:MAG: glycosyltransferase [Gemmobacter sp.]